MNIGHWPHYRAVAAVAVIVVPDIVRRHCLRTEFYPPVFAKNKGAPEKKDKFH